MTTTRPVPFASADALRQQIAAALLDAARLLSEATSLQSFGAVNYGDQRGGLNSASAR